MSDWKPSAAKRQRIFDRDGNACVNCGSMADLTLDHVQLVSKGGSHDDDNLRTLCMLCNQRKGNRSMAYLRAQTTISSLNLDGVLYYPEIGRRLASVTAGLLLSQLVYWSRRSTDDDGWLWKTQEQLSDELAMSRREQETARRVLREAGLIAERKAGVPARLYFRVDFAQLAALFGANVHPRMAQTAMLDWPNAPHKDGAMRQTNLTVTTAATTAEQQQPTHAHTQAGAEQAPAGDTDWANCMLAAYSQVTGAEPATDAQWEALRQALSDHRHIAVEDIADAAQETVRNRGNWRYFCAILTNWHANGKPGRTPHHAARGRRAAKPRPSGRYDGEGTVGANAGSHDG